jgi:hypothetical protein
MYITGSNNTFASRVHQLPEMTPFGMRAVSSGQVTGFVDLKSFLIEGRAYLNSGFALPSESGRWEQECRNHYYRMSGVPFTGTSTIFDWRFP